MAGNTPERLNNPWGVVVDSNQALYVVDRNNHRVMMWPNGSYRHFLSSSVN